MSSDEGLPEPTYQALGRPRMRKQQRVAAAEAYESFGSFLK